MSVLSDGVQYTPDISAYAVIDPSNRNPNLTTSYEMATCEYAQNVGGHGHLLGDDAIRLVLFKELDEFNCTRGVAASGSLSIYTDKEYTDNECVCKVDIVAKQVEGLVEPSDIFVSVIWLEEYTYGVVTGPGNESTNGYVTNITIEYKDKTNLYSTKSLYINKDANFTFTYNGSSSIYPMILTVPAGSSYKKYTAQTIKAGATMGNFTASSDVAFSNTPVTSTITVALPPIKP